METSCSYDFLYAGSSVDGQNFRGTRYCGDWTGGSEANGYHEVTLSLGDRLGEKAVWIALMFRSDSTTTDIGTTVDDIVLHIQQPLPNPHHAAGKRDRDTYHHGHSDSYGGLHGHTDGDGDAHTDGVADRHGDSHANSDSHGGLHGHADRHGDAHTDGVADRHRHSHCHPYGDAFSYAHCDGDAAPRPAPPPAAGAQILSATANPHTDRYPDCDPYTYPDRHANRKQYADTVGYAYHHADLCFRNPGGW